MENKYLVFSGDYYYPSGGWQDFKGEFDSLYEALEFIRSGNQCKEWVHIVHQKEIISSATSKHNSDYTGYDWEFKNTEINFEYICQLIN